MRSIGHGKIEILLVIVGIVLLAYGTLLSLFPTFSLKSILTTDSKESYEHLLSQNDSAHGSNGLKASLIPSKVSISRIGVEAEIVPGGVAGNNWLLSPRYAHFFSVINREEQFNVVVYAHNTKNLFYNLRKVAYGDRILISDKNGGTREFIVYSIERINPREISKVEETFPGVLTLFTCDGWLDEVRLVVKAKQQDGNGQKVS